MSELNVWGVRLGEALGDGGRVVEGEADGDCDWDGEALGEREALGEVLGEVPVEGLVELDALEDAEGLLLALADPLGLPEAAGDEDGMQIVVIGMHCSAIRREALAIAPEPVTGNSAPSMATQRTSTILACVLALLRPSSSRGIKNLLLDRRLRWHLALHRLHDPYPSP